MPKIIKKCILKRQLAYAIMAVAKKEIIKSKQHTPLSVARLGATTLDIIPQRQKCHNKPFSLVYHQSHKEKSVKGGRKTAEFTLDALFCWLSCRRGKRLSVRSVTSPCASLSVPAEESKG